MRISDGSSDVSSSDLRRYIRFERPPEANISTIALLFVDLDRFKAINDAHGHSAGDAVLTTLGQRIARTAAPHFTCRLGGDEFVVMVEGGDEIGRAHV